MGGGEVRKRSSLSQTLQTAPRRLSAEHLSQRQQNKLNATYKMMVWGENKLVNYRWWLEMTFTLSLLRTSKLSIERKSKWQVYLLLVFQLNTAAKSMIMLSVWEPDAVRIADLHGASQQNQIGRAFGKSSGQLRGWFRHKRFTIAAFVWVSFSTRHMSI